MTQARPREMGWQFINAPARRVTQTAEPGYLFSVSDESRSRRAA